MHHSFLKHVAFILILLSIISLACSRILPNAQTDPSYRYDNLPNESNEDESISKYRAISQWGKTNISYFFVNGTNKINGDAERDLIRAAFKLWADETPLSFNEAADSAQADILIGWAEGEHGDGDPFDGPGDVLAHASYPNPYNEKQVFLHFLIKLMIYRSKK